MKRIDVAVGIITNTEGAVLVGQRLIKDAYYQKWEFPGGKLEQGESIEEALTRELKEELDILVRNCQQFMTIEHDYPDRQVRLSVCIVNSYTGEAVGAEGQALKWVDLEDLNKLDFLKGNQAIIEELLKRSV